MTVRRLSVFPLGGALLLPRSYLPLHIFEPRYKAMIQDALVRDRRIGMVQPRGAMDRAGGTPAQLFDVGCIGRIADVEVLDDGRFNIVLQGATRFAIVRELDLGTPFRQVEPDTSAFAADEDDPDPLPAVVRAAVEEEARRMAAKRNLAIDWTQVGRLDDEGLVNGLAQAVPFDTGAKQALLESPTLASRAELLTQFLAFAAGGSDTMQ